MKKKSIIIAFFVFILNFFYPNFLQAQTKDELKSAINRVSRVITYQDQEFFAQDVIAELAYLKRTYQLDSCDVRLDRYVNSLNDYYYKIFFLYSKLLNDTTVVTEDCLNDDANSKINQLNKLFFYALYPNTIALPKNYIDLLEEYSTVDEFFGPYYVLNTAYFLKKYNIQNLSKAQKEKLNSLVNQLCNTIYTKYVKNNNLWNFYKFSALKVLLMNEYEPAQKTDISQVITYINAGGPLKLSDEDRNDVELMNRAGGDYVFRHSLNASMWIFLLELNKN